MAEEQEMNEQNQEDEIREFSAPPSAASSSTSSENLRVLENIEAQLVHDQLENLGEIHLTLRHQCLHAMLG